MSATEECALKPTDVFKECDKCPEMVVVPAGSFTMGSTGRDEGPEHIVTIGRPFAVGRLHVTVDQYAAFVAKTRYSTGSTCETYDDNPRAKFGHSWRNPGFAQQGSHPVVCVSWNDAKAYVAWLAKKMQRSYRLLTEAEFEYAARALTSPGRYPRFWFGDDEKDLCRYGNGADQTEERVRGKTVFAAAPCNDGYAYTAPAGSFEANGFGLSDMLGNAWEHTKDCYNESYQGAPADGSPWTEGDCGQRVHRGGSWLVIPLSLHAARRDYGSTTDRRVFDIGFRVARTLIGP